MMVDLGTSQRTIALTGASGLVGSRLRIFLEAQGHQVISLVRSKPGLGERLWDPHNPDTALLEGVDTVIHIAGSPIFGRFTGKHKKQVRDSRVGPTRALAELAAQTSGVTTMITASAVGYYGYQADEVVDEFSPRGAGFLADVCDCWERACAPAQQGGVRVVHIRTGLVLDGRGGILKVLATLTKTGLSGPLAGGQQWFAWVAGEDLVRIYAHAVDNSDLYGPVNAVGPQKVTNKQFTKILADVVHRPAVIPVPGWVPAVLLGRQGAEELALASQHVDARVLTNRGFTFCHGDARSAIRAELETEK
ncbi:TIGR01777 family oxidoreductase [Corynebacterium mastitidis]|uniref:TIGR01777 family oxidoreductase n=1 Tax=Corynebacterium mastitidis TaxID=161890 RepID=UPI0025508019|nr:TIGR01777 family oxidoreductase [Corynebacterium mastitidis]MDK8451445.1 TIGR01777 family oxidoreductase [Corynebacterium mastitidis]